MSLLLTVVPGAVTAAAEASEPGPDSRWPQLLAAQYTYVEQWQSALTSPYQGKLSLHPEGDHQPTHTIGFYSGWAPLDWSQLYFDVEKFMGAGVSGATGLACKSPPGKPKWRTPTASRPSARAACR